MHLNNLFLIHRIYLLLTKAYFLHNEIVDEAFITGQQPCSIKNLQPTIDNSKSLFVSGIFLL